jgi:hypothetical protein
MKIGILIPTLGGIRKPFLDHNKYLISNQTLQPDINLLIDDTQTQFPNDINIRYRIGCERLFHCYNCDIVLFIEDDDYYFPQYIEKMITKWQEVGKPSMFGISNTLYYQLRALRSSMMCMAVTRDILDIEFPNVKFLDCFLWSNYAGTKVSAKFDKFICIGIKHGIGLVGGDGHSLTENLKMWKEQDSEYKYLQELLKNDKKSFEFYKNIVK